MTELFAHIPNPKNVQFVGVDRKVISYTRDDMKAMTSHQLITLKRWLDDELSKRRSEQ